MQVMHSIMVVSTVGRLGLDLGLAGFQAEGQARIVVNSKFMAVVT
jgi:hypothetical protein